MFNLTDRVRVIAGDEYFGKEGSIHSFDATNANLIWVEIDNDETGETSFDMNELQLVTYDTIGLDLGLYEKYLDDNGMLTDTMADQLIAEIRRLRDNIGALEIGLHSEEHNHKIDNKILLQRAEEAEEQVRQLNEERYRI